MYQKQTMLSYQELYSYENLFQAYERARKGKTQKSYVLEFEKNLQENLLSLQEELRKESYRPLPLKTFILQDPKIRKISKSAFRDRIVHHAVYAIIESPFEAKFIHDSYANRIGKGTINALKRLDTFKRKISKNNTKKVYALKADIKQYFEHVNHHILFSLLQKEIQDEKILSLINYILQNYNGGGNGMPLGNLTSQFFANVYLHELDTFVKHTLRAKYYIRYVDDFVLLHTNKESLQQWKENIEKFLLEKLNLTLHPQKTKILRLEKGIPFLGFRVFYYHKLLQKKNIRKFQKTFQTMEELYKDETLEREKAVEKFEGWMAFAVHGETYKLRKTFAKRFNRSFPIENTAPIFHMKNQEKFQSRLEEINREFTQQKTLYLLRKGHTIEKIARKRQLKEGTIWEHARKLIAYGAISIYTILKKEEVQEIQKAFFSSEEAMKQVYERLKGKYSYNKIQSVQAHLQNFKKEMKIFAFFLWYQKKHCYRKCSLNKKQRDICKTKMKLFAAKNSKLHMKKKEHLELFNNHLQICVLPEKEKRRYVTWEVFRNSKKTQK